MPLLLTKPATAVSAGDVWITAAMANPSGSESYDEYVVLTNNTSSNVDVSGWTLDTDGQSDTFGSVSIPANDTLKVCSGSSADTTVSGCDVFGFSMGLSNSSGQTLTLSDNTTPTPNEIDQVSYTASRASSEDTEITFTSPLSAPTPTITTRYVNATTGTDSGSCGAATPCKTLQYVIDQANTGDSIEIESNLITTSSQTTIDKSVTINGNGRTLNAAFAKTNNGNNSALGIQANNVTINNLVVDGTGSTNLHGINVYSSTDVNINYSTARNFNTNWLYNYGLVVNNSIVTILNFTTSGNFGGINVGKRGDAGTSSLIVNGTSHHSGGQAIYVESGHVTDTNNQYNMQNIPEWGAIYWLKSVQSQLAAPTHLSWETASGKTVADGGITNEYSGTAIWQDGTPTGETSDVDHYVYKYWNDIPGNQYKPGSEWPHPTTSKSLPGKFDQGEGVHHFCVAAVDAAGNESSCTEFTITYDTTAPTIGEIKVVAPNGDTMQNAPRYNPWKVITTGNNDENGVAGVYAYVYRQDGANWTRLDPEIELGTPDQHIHYFEQSSNNLDYWVSSKNAGNFKDGHTYRLVVWAKDKSGNESDHTDDLTVPNSAVGSASYFSPAFTIDHTAPKVLLNTPNNGSTIQGVVSIKGTIIETNPDHYYLRIEDESGHVVYQKTYYNTPQTFTDYSMYNWDTSVIADGNYAIYLEARDGANNKDGDRAVPGDSVAVSHVIVGNTGPNMGADDNSNLGNTDTSGDTSDSGSGGSQTGGGGLSGPSSLAVVLTPLSDGLPGVLGSVASSLGLPGVLGTSTTQGNAGSTDGSNNSSNDGSGVKGDSVNRGGVLGDATKDDSCFNILGICWYWWIPVVIIVMAIIYYLSRGKGKKAQNTTA